VPPSAAGQAPRDWYIWPGQVELPWKVTPSQPQKGATSAVQGRGVTHVHRTSQPGGPSHIIEGGQSEVLRHARGVTTSTGGPASTHARSVHESEPPGVHTQTLQPSGAGQRWPTGHTRPSGKTHAGGPASTHARPVHAIVPSRPHEQELQPSPAGHVCPKGHTRPSGNVQPTGPPSTPSQGPRWANVREGHVELEVKVRPSQPQKVARSSVHGRPRPGPQ